MRSPYIDSREGTLVFFVVRVQYDSSFAYQLDCDVCPSKLGLRMDMGCTSDVHRWTLRIKGAYGRLMRDLLRYEPQIGADCLA